MHRRQFVAASAGITALVAAAIMLWTRNTPPGALWPGGRGDAGSCRHIRSVPNARRWAG